MKITIKADSNGLKNIRNWLKHEVNGYFSYPNNATTVKVADIDFLPDWVKKQVLDTGYKTAGSYHYVGGDFYLGVDGEWVAVSENGDIKMAGQFHELQYYISVIRNNGKVTEWLYSGHHDEHIGLAPWQPPKPKQMLLAEQENARPRLRGRPHPRADYTCHA